MAKSEPMSVVLKEGEMVVRRIEGVKFKTYKPGAELWDRDILLHATGVLLLTDRRLIHYATSPPRAQDHIFEVSLSDVTGSSLKKPWFEKKKIFTVNTRRVVWTYPGLAEPMSFEPLAGHIVLWDIEQPEALRSGMIEQVKKIKSPPKVEKCPQCGSSLPADAVFCPACGKRVR